MAGFLEKGFISEVFIRGRCILRVVGRGFKGGAYQVGAGKRKKLLREGAFLERGLSREREAYQREGLIREGASSVGGNERMKLLRERAF